MRCLLRSVELEPIDPLAWLMAQGGQAKVFWSRRDQKEVFAGLGEAWEVTAQGSRAYHDALQEVHTFLDDADPDVRFVGGCRFSTAAVSEAEWSGWPTARFILPRIALIQDERSCRLIGFIPHFSADGAAKALEAALLELSETTAQVAGSAVAYRCRHDLVGEQAWCANVDEVLAAIRSQDMKKAVLARAVDFNLEGEPSSLSLLQGLRQVVSNGFHFCFQADARHGFFGVTPELLYQRRGRALTSEALAGTTSRSDDAEEDTALAKALQGDNKERREHLSVLEYLEAALQPLCTRLDRIAVMEYLKLPKVQHLYSSLQGSLRPGVGDADLLSALHPTPSVSGVPQSVAQAFIERLEPFDRGWYAGPIGWVSAEEAEFAVALRCGLLVKDVLRVYAGAGIVEGSDALCEWRETEIKLANWMTLFLPV